MGAQPQAVERRLHRLQQVMEQAQVDLLVIGPSADFQYLTGHMPILSERLTALVVPRQGRATVVVPRLEAPLLADLADRYNMAIWDETERPAARVAAIGREIGARTVAVNDQLWSVFLLQLEELLASAAFQSAAGVLSRLRATKEADEVALLREAARRTDAAWEEFCATSRLTGQTELQVEARLRELMAKHGITDEVFCIVASGPNSASPHHHNTDRVIQPGDPVVIDFGGRYQGYFSDITRTPVAGEPHPDLVKIYEIVKAAQQAAFEAIRPGVACQDVDRAARRVITEAGYGEYFIHRVGHGLGLTVHEEPYLVEGNAQPLQPGMVVSDEPGVYIAGQWGVRIEDAVVVTEDGAERLNQVSRELIALP
ncbi:MAG: Xaa-Pro peptidase family protein [Sphaerobacter sp.]|nr:Xaa-Pro peptidase family protein [Sphaerobacter sp.]